VAHDKDYYSFDEVLSDLRMEEEELKRLVSAGEIRAFREKDTMRFKAADIERLKSTPEDDDLGLDLGEDLDLDMDSMNEDQDLDLSDGGEELVLDDDLDGGSGLEVEEVDLAAGRRGGGSRSSSSSGSAPSRRVPRSQAQAAGQEEGSEGAGMLFLLGLGFVILIFANFAAAGAVDGTTNALTGFIADMFAG
jgi:hypothetical protein